MGQYWLVVNLDKREYVNPHMIGTGLKLWEQLANHPGTGAALVLLCAAMPEQRGGGDFDLDKNWHGPERKFPVHNITPAEMPKDYQTIAHAVIGRWAGDRIALVGDYAERGDLPASDKADLIYSLCNSKEAVKESIEYLEKAGRVKEAAELRKAKPYRDISLLVAAVIEHELHGKYSGDGWRDWSPTQEK